MSSLLELDDLHTTFRTREGEMHAVRGVSFQVQPGELVGIVGESGCGKSVTCKSIIQLLGSNGRITGGSIRFQNEDLAQKTPAQMRDIRGNEIAMIFQDPMTALNPVLTIGKQMAEILMRNKGLSKKAAKAAAIAMLQQVGIAEAERRYDQYPHEFSGGMRQRVMIAIALSCNPKLLIADEPTTALDVTIQAQILRLLKSLQQQTQTAILLITHDLGVVAQVCSRVVVMYGGLVMEEGSVEDIFYRPAHPYTRGLLASLPRPDEENQRLSPIEGSPPGLLNPPPGCPFAERCPKRMPQCERQPAFYSVGEGHRAACWLWADKEIQA
ncbi:Oligopeptide transport ATP-binding protein OppD [Enterobacter cloacae]|uniref:ABC-type dipeptide transporter n=1 Tax=Enterobacter sichuanensis TaxID=2071710 RepID=A0AAE4E064_9ENTR|nr:MULTISPECIES: ABC transporter ATP-binding protein [Enterobacter]OZV01431.1 ABC transporter ATP-binding protein [Enterobacter cloacae]MBO2914540.1 ABC transporter ATP-binding protein [Enterobacter sichuanensis]MBO2932508.1 ABC transporter ATP-binding protein [Enterobacter sichuanensis]MBU5925552.1 ABC transporter ATP-binding protein [Enterobacter sichuanensis]MCI8904896.1 ABC transporter ATP-binding protein [Enterobacter sp.]